jgi:glucose-6-phosphate isomerase
MEAKIMFTQDQNLGVTVDLQRMGAVHLLLSRWQKAFSFLDELEGGAIANPDEGRQVGHYWLRNPTIAPKEIATVIEHSWAQLGMFAAEVCENGWKHLLMVGIGGSALGPQLLMDALGVHDAPLSVHFIDNTDPDGMERVLHELSLKDTLVAVLSKSGGTKETRNGMLEVRHVFTQAGIDFTEHAIAVTVPGSALDQLAESEDWLQRLPLWSWIGGRTSVTGMVGLLPLALSGLDWQSFLRGASDMDVQTRSKNMDNPALLLAAAWHHAGEGKGTRAMVVLPYKDRLILFPRYLQQLVMESLGKRLDMNGTVVQQGLTVYGNKGSTDQHAFVQQLREGPDDFFVTFVSVLEGRKGEAIEVDPGIRSEDYLLGFLIGTRNALSQAGRKSLTIILERLDAYRMGALIALYERAVGLYAAYIGVNAYHQPGVEAGKKAAAVALALQEAIVRGDPVKEGDDADLIRAYLQYNGRLS